MNDYYNKKLKPLARKLRKSSTQGEIKLWCEVLRAKKMKGYQFLRQRPIGNYITDFMCKDLKLVIEIDGYSHQFKFMNDLKRDEYMEHLGFTIIRFTEKQIHTDIMNVKRTIENWIESSEQSKENTSPLPPSKGD